MSSLPVQIVFGPRTPDDERLRAILRQLCVVPASDVESDTLEIKNWCQGERDLGEKVSEAAMCLANASGGFVLVGIDDGHAKGFSACPHLNVRSDWISQRIHDNTVPPVEVQVQDISEMLRTVASMPNVNAFAIRVEKSKRPAGHQTTAGLAKIRDGNRCKPYYFTEDDRTQAPVPTAAASDLSKTSIEWGMEQHQRKFRVPKDRWASPYDFLLEIGLLERHSPNDDATLSFRVTLAGLLMFGKQEALKRHFPCCETVVITPHSDRRFALNLVETYKELCVGKNAFLVSLCPHIPSEIIRELVVNALVHRSYRLAAPITISLRESALEIESPGELPGPLTTDTLLHCTPVYRNFLLADAARYLGMCDRIGQGIDRVYEFVLSGGFGFPTFESSNGRFSAIIPLRGNREFQEFIRKKAYPLDSLDEMIVLRLMYDRDKASFWELCKVMQRGTDVGQKVVDEMFRKLMIEPVDGATAQWRLAPNVRTVINEIFNRDQMDLDLDLFGYSGSH
jgi:ATP-dependent DNA helicase RecG